MDYRWKRSLFHITPLKQDAISTGLINLCCPRQASDTKMSVNIWNSFTLQLRSNVSQLMVIFTKTATCRNLHKVSRSNDSWMRVPTWKSRVQLQSYQFYGDTGLMSSAVWKWETTAVAPETSRSGPSSSSCHISNTAKILRYYCIHMHVVHVAIASRPYLPPKYLTWPARGSGNSRLML